MEDLKNLDFMSIINMIIEFVKKILKFEFPEIGGFLGDDESADA